jgi:hypothetical protein
MSLKEKIQVVLNQKGQFKYPNGAGSSKAASKPKTKPAMPPPQKPTDNKFSLVVANLKQRGHARPRKLKTPPALSHRFFPMGCLKLNLVR